MTNKKIIATIAAIFLAALLAPALCLVQNGAGIVIAVPLPQLKSAQKTDEWIPQFMQDSLTTNLARYSKMTVIDRANESLALAEQKLSENAQFNEATAIEIGKMTNAKFVLAGSVQALSNAYSVNFRVNSIETNEIKASFQKNYTIAQIESGAAVQEISKEIMLGLGIQLDAAALAALGKTDDKAISVNQNLAKGAAAEKNQDFLTALAYFSKVREEEGANVEANKSIQNILGGNIPTQGLKAQIEYGQNMIKRWNKIFADLGKYLESDELEILIYDFSNVETSISYYGEKAYVSFTISPGVKIIPNRSALILCKTILDEWCKTSSKAENQEWAKAVKLPSSGNGLYGNYGYCGWGLGRSTEFRVSCNIRAVIVALFDDYGDKIAEKEVRDSFQSSLGFNIQLHKENVIAQQKYFEENRFSEIRFESISADKITDVVKPKLESIRASVFPKRCFTMQQYQDWLAAGCP